MAKPTVFSKLLTVIIALGLVAVGLQQLGLLDKIMKKLPNAAQPTTAPAANQSTSTNDIQARNNVFSEIRERGMVRIALEPNAPPMYFVNDMGLKDGFDYQLSRLIAQKMGVDAVQVVEADYSELPNLVLQNKADVLMSGYVPDPSVGGISWSEGYLEFGLCLIVKQGSPIRETSHLNGQRIGIYDDPAAENWVRENVPSPREVRKFEGTGWFVNLDNNTVDALVYDYPFAIEEIKHFPYLKIVKLNLNQMEYSIGLPAGNGDFKMAIDQALAELMQSEAYSQLVKTYLKAKVDVAAVPAGAKKYTVRPGDTLSKIAQSQLSNKDRWHEIWDLNKSRIANPHLIFEGDVLQMP